MPTKEYFTSIRNLIARDDLVAAIRQLRQLLEHSPSLDEVIHQSGRFHDIRRQIRLGTISNADANLTQNQIRTGLLELLREIEEQDTHNAHIHKEIEHSISVLHSKNVVTGSVTAGGDVVIGDHTTITESTTSQRLKLFLYVFVPLLAIGGVYWWYRYQQMQQPLSLKVQIENRTPSAELPEPVGTLQLSYGDVIEPPKNNIQEHTLFDGIPAGAARHPFRLQYRANGFVPKDTSFLYVKNTIVVLPVRRNDDLAMLTGKISDDDGKALSGVRVSIAGCCTDMTDASGNFVLVIPFAHQREKQRIDLA